MQYSYSAKLKELEDAIMNRKGKKSGDEITFLCPAHEDHNPSASYNTDKKVWFCHACDAKGDWIDLAQRFGIVLETSKSKRELQCKSNSIETTYDYTDENGQLLYQIVRKQASNPPHIKEFRVRRRDNNGEWTWGLGDRRRVLYRLPLVLKAINERCYVFIVEGEKNVEDLLDLGLFATCNPFGATKWLDEYSDSLQNAMTVIIPDNDDIGREHLQKVGLSLQGKAAEIKVIFLPGLPYKGDVSDWLVNGGTRVKLEKLVAKANIWNSLPDLTERKCELITEDKSIEHAETYLENIFDLEMEEVFSQQTIHALAILKLKHPCGWGKAHALLKKRNDISLRNINYAINKEIRDINEAEQEKRKTKPEQPSNDPYKSWIGNDTSYQIQDYQFYLVQYDANINEIYQRLSNFCCRVVREIIEDDGSEEITRRFELEGRLKNGTILPPIQIPASQFQKMTWIHDCWGIGPSIDAGYRVKDHVRAAIEAFSGINVTRHTIYKHSGWRKINGQWAYLHAGGAISRDGALKNIEVSLHENLSLFSLPDPPTGSKMISSIRASLQVINIAPYSITVPLLSAVYRAVLGHINFSLWFGGPSGAGKTTLILIGQQHFGAEIDEKSIPATWESTANSLEVIAFSAKDVLVLIDDFVPVGTSIDIQRLHRKADRLLRTQANQTGRQRLKQDSSLQTTKSPRGLIISTGEDVPRGQSLRARMAIIEMSKTDLDWKKVDYCQAKAKEGVYACSLGSFVRWIAPQYDNIEKNILNERNRLAGKLFLNGQHRRTSRITADLAIGWKYFLEFAYESKAISRSEKEKYWNKGIEALRKMDANQQTLQEFDNQARLYLHYISSCIASGRAHVANPNGYAPENPGSWGWRQFKNTYTGEEWKPQGDRIGWISDEGLFLEDKASFGVVQSFGQKSNNPLTITVRTLHKRLDESNLLMSKDENRQTLTIRKRFEGRDQHVIHLSTDCLTYV